MSADQSIKATVIVVSRIGGNIEQVRYILPNDVVPMYAYIRQTNSVDGLANYLDVEAIKRQETPGTRSLLSEVKQTYQLSINDPFLFVFTESGSKYRVIVDVEEACKVLAVEYGLVNSDIAHPFWKEEPKSEKKKVKKTSKAVEVEPVIDRRRVTEWLAAAAVALLLGNKVSSARPYQDPFSVNDPSDPSFSSLYAVQNPYDVPFYGPTSYVGPADFETDRQMTDVGPVYGDAWVPPPSEGWSDYVASIFK